MAADALVETEVAREECRALAVRAENAEAEAARLTNDVRGLVLEVSQLELQRDTHRAHAKLLLKEKNRVAGENQRLRKELGVAAAAAAPAQGDASPPTPLGTPVIPTTPRVAAVRHRPKSASPASPPTPDEAFAPATPGASPGEEDAKAARRERLRMVDEARRAALRCAKPDPLAAHALDGMWHS